MRLTRTCRGYYRWGAFEGSTEVGRSGSNIGDEVRGVRLAAQLPQRYQPALIRPNDTAFQVGAAKVVAGAERHGDGGTQVLADTAGLTRREARSQVKTARVIEAAPAVRDAAESGRVPQANIKRLAETIEKTSAADVESDSDLLAKAQSMRPDQFTREARRWAADRQDGGGEADYRRLRARRCVRIWDSDDGTVELHGTFDPVAGGRIGNRLEAEARRLYDIDKKQAAEAGPDERRTFHQCMADALDHLTAPSARAGPAAARAVLHNARAQPSTTPSTAAMTSASPEPSCTTPERNGRQIGPC